MCFESCHSFLLRNRKYIRSNSDKINHVDKNLQAGLLPGVLLGVLERLADLFTLLLGEREFVFVELDVLAFLCHLAIGAFVIGMSNLRTLWMSFSKPKWAMCTVVVITIEKRYNYITTVIQKKWCLMFEKNIR